jgi:hypothetical protein
MPPPTVLPSQVFLLNILLAVLSFGQTIVSETQIAFPQHVLTAQTSLAAHSEVAAQTFEVQCELGETQAPVPSAVAMHKQLLPLLHVRYFWHLDSTHF